MARPKIITVDKPTADPVTKVIPIDWYGGRFYAGFEVDSGSPTFTVSYTLDADLRNDPDPASNLTWTVLETDQTADVDIGFGSPITGLKVDVTGAATGTIIIKPSRPGKGGPKQGYPPGKVNNPKHGSGAPNPPVNTRLYIPADTDLNDYSGNSVPMTPNGTAALNTTDPKIGAGSLYGDGGATHGTNYLVTNTDAANSLGTGDFTISGWFKIDSTRVAASDTFCVACGSGDAYTNALHWAITVRTKFVNIGYILWYEKGAARIVPAATSTFDTGWDVWEHLAVVRKSGTTYLAHNGAWIGTPYASSGTTDLGSNTNQIHLLSGLAGAGDNGDWPGWIDDFTVIKGTAYWDGVTPFTPPTAPLT